MEQDPTPSWIGWRSRSRRRTAGAGEIKKPFPRHKSAENPVQFQVSPASRGPRPQGHRCISFCHTRTPTPPRDRVRGIINLCLHGKGLALLSRGVGKHFRTALTLAKRSHSATFCLLTAHVLTLSTVEVRYSEENSQRI